MLGWKILENGERKLNMKKLSQEEEELILKIEERYGKSTRKENIRDKDHAKEEIEKILNNECEELGLMLDRDQEEYLLNSAVKHIFGFSFLEELLEDEDIEEISVIGLNKPIYIFHRSKGWLEVNASFTNEETLREIINKMAKNTGRRITLKKPRVNAVLDDGSRIHATLAPISSGELTIRKFRSNPFSPIELVENKTIDLDEMAFLSATMHSDSNVMIAGNTASGKTTLLNSLFSFIPSKERIVIIEETPELNILQKHKLRMVSNEESGIGLSDLVYDSLRMRPDRTIIGEIRNKKESDAMFDIMLSGQSRGGYCTIHGRSILDTIQRLRSFDASDEDINSIDIIVVQRRLLKYDNKKRRNFEIRRVLEIGSPRSKEFVKIPEKIEKSNLFYEVGNRLGLSRKEFIAEIEYRKKIIKNSKKNFLDSFKYIQKKYYNL